MDYEDWRKSSPERRKSLHLLKLCIEYCGLFPDHGGYTPPEKATVFKVIQGYKQRTATFRNCVVYCGPSIVEIFLSAVNAIIYDVNLSRLWWFSAYACTFVICFLADLFVWLLLYNFLYHSRIKVDNYMNIINLLSFKFAIHDKIIQCY